MVPLLADAAGFHAHVASADDHPYPLRLQMLLQRVGDLIGEPLLDLKPTGEHVRQAGELGQPYNLAVRDVGDSSRTENVRQVVLTFGVDWDVLDDHHLVVLLGPVLKYLEDIRGILAVPTAPVGPCFGHAARGLPQATAFRVLTDELEQTLDVVFDPTLGGLLPREDHPAAVKLTVLFGLIDQSE